MSLLGQKQQFDPLPATSGLPLRTDIVRPAWLVWLVPIPEVATLFYNLVRELLETQRDIEAMSLDRSLTSASSSAP